MDNLPFTNSVVGDKGASVKSKHIINRLNMIDGAFTNGDIDFQHVSTSHMYPFRYA